MGSDDQQAIELAKEGIKQVFAPVQDIVQRLLGPAATEIGLSFADSARVWRFERAIRLFKRVKKMAAAAQIDVNPVAPNLIFPIIEAASLANDDLQESWAALLTNAATTNFVTEVLPSFPDILRQLTPAEVRFLDKVEHELEHDEPRRREQLKGGMPWLHGEPFLNCPLRKDTLASVSRIMLGNLQRLGLLSPHRERDFDDEGTHNVFEPTNYLYLSQFGRAFVRACRPPESRL